MKKLLLLATVAMLSSPTLAANDRGKVMATVNGANIYEDSVNIIYKGIPAGDIEKMGGSEKVQKVIMDQLAAAEALKQASLKSDIEKSKDFQKLLKLEKERLLQEEYLRIEVEKRISAKDVKSAYDKALKEFKAETEYNVYNILSTTEKDAKAIIKELDKGADFQKLSAEKSASSNAKKTKGNLGFIKTSELIDNIAKEISSLKEGSYSKKPIKSPFGWNVFYLKESRLEKAPTYAESKASIQKSMSQKEMIKLIKELKDKANVVYK